MSRKLALKILGVVFAVQLIAMTWFAHAGSIRLGWDANSEPEVIGYNIYVKNHINEDYRPMTEIFEQDLDNPLMPTIGVWGLTDTLTYYFVATAFSEDAESAFSNEAIWTGPEPPPDEPPPDELPPDEPGDGNGDVDKDKNSKSGGGGCFISSLR